MKRGGSHQGSLVADGVENPRNARALMDAASMFAIPALFRDTSGLLERWDEHLGGSRLVTIDSKALLQEQTPIVAIENARGSESLFSVTVKGSHSMVVGNERRGIGRDVLRVATRTLHIPTAGSARINTLNVASAAAVALHALSRSGTIRTQTPRPDRRPNLLLMAPRDHVEAGSALRTAAAFGWRMVALEDRCHVWFDTPRPIRTEGRAAARSHRAALRVARYEGLTPGFDRVTVASTSLDAPPLHRLRLDSGPSSVLVLPDEGSIDEGSEDWGRLGREVRLARIDVPASDFSYRYRLTASIAMAEIARQIGIHGREVGAASRRGLTYESVLRTLSPEHAEEITWDALSLY